MRARFVALSICAALAAGAAARAEVYLWTDDQGRIHMTDDLSQVPSSQRARAQQAAQSADSSAAARFVRPNAGAAAPAASDEDAPAPVRRGRAPASARPGRRYLIEVERSSNEMRVAADVDGVLVHFILDTGATSCTLPGWAAREMGLQIDERTPRVNVVGIDGTPRAVPQVQIQSVAIGDLVVEDVEMNVIDTMQEGLLGMPFFNRFKVSTDPTAGTLILEEIGSDARDDAVQGKNEDSWRKQFAPLRSSLQEVRSQLAGVPHEYTTTRERLEKREAELQRQLDELDERATRAGVPQSWRE